MAFIQSTILPRLTLFGLRPDLMLLVVVSWSLVRGTREGVGWAFGGGILLDLMSGAPLGTATLALMVVSFLSGSRVVTSVLRSHVLLPLLTIFLATLLYDGLFLFILQLAGRPVPWIETLIRIVLPTAVLNAILTPLFYRAMRELHRASRREEVHL